VIPAGNALGYDTRVFACGGYSPAEALRAWRRYGEPSAARLVVVQFYEGNDLYDVVDLADLRAQGATLTSYAERLAPNLPATIRASRFTRALFGWIAVPTDTTLPPLLRGQRWLARESFSGLSAPDLARFPAMSYEEITRAARDSEIFQPGFPDPIVLSRPRDEAGAEVLPLVFAVDPAQFYSSFGEWEAKRRSGLLLLSETFEELERMAALHGFEVAVLYIPTAMNAARPLLEREPTMLRMLDRALRLAVPGRAHEAVGAIARWRDDRQSVREALGALASFHGFRFIDTTDQLRSIAAESARRADTEFPYLPYDTHLSPSGNRAVAASVVDAIFPMAGADAEADADAPAARRARSAPKED
jgi:hypothetical protein